MHWYKFDKCFEEVQNSNMSKLMITENHLIIMESYEGTVILSPT